MFPDEKEDAGCGSNPPFSARTLSRGPRTASGGAGGCLGAGEISAVK